MSVAIALQEAKAWRSEALAHYDALVANEPELQRLTKEATEDALTDDAGVERIRAWNDAVFARPRIWAARERFHAASTLVKELEKQCG